MFKIIEVKALENYKIRLKYSDGTEGTVDLSYLAGKGVFAVWDDYNKFRNVSIGTSGELVWNNEVDLCADALYLQLTGKKPEDFFKKFGKDAVNA
ncbi:MAG: DUF2442 domain-containing protein [Pseudomonadota bacterium]